ncbi:hypothetical protein Trydic_g9207 [Trypoxylus dichotomus]
MSPLPCACVCGSVNDEHKTIECYVCEKFYYQSCVDLSTTDVRTIEAKKGLSWSCRECESLGSDRIELKAAILSLKNNVASKSSSSGIADELFEEILQEMDERNKRRNDIIIFNLPESESTDSSDRRARRRRSKGIS